MSDKYIPKKVWKWDPTNGGKFAHLNRPVSGFLENKDLPRGNHLIQLYSMGTPNGVKVTIMLEELLAIGETKAEYDAFYIDILKGDQFSSGFVGINPNSKIPALIDYGVEKPVRVFESGSILLYLADKFNSFISKDLNRRTETLNWLFWQMGSAPYLGGGFGHFYAYAPEKIKYAIDRFSMESKRQLDVLDQRLSENEYIAGDDYSIADMAIWPWYGSLVLDDLYGASEFLEVNMYKHVQRWGKNIANREAVKKGRLVNRAWGPEDKQLRQRNSPEDFANLNLN